MVDSKQKTLVKYTSSRHSTLCQSRSKSQVAKLSLMFFTYHLIQGEGRYAVVVEILSCRAYAYTYEDSAYV